MVCRILNLTSYYFKSIIHEKKMFSSLRAFTVKNNFIKFKTLNFSAHAL